MMSLGSSFGWLLDLAERCVGEAKGDRDLALEMMVSECIPRWVLEGEFSSYIETALHRDEIADLEPEEIIRRGLEAGIRNARRRSN
jgi:hypothetical protein